MTISFNGLGNEGRLGNQLFQYALLRYGRKAQRWLGDSWT